MTRTKLSVCAAVILMLVACGGDKAPANDAHTTTAETTPQPQKETQPATSEAPEGCHVFTLVRPPTIETKKVGSMVLHGDKPGSLATITPTGGELIATTVAEVEQTMCKKLPPKAYLVHMMKEKGNIVAEISTPVAAPDVGHDARAICDAQREGAKLGVPADDQLSEGLRQSAGSLTTKKYRDLLWGAIQGDETQSMNLVKTLDTDIRAQGKEAYDRCTLLVKK